MLALREKRKRLGEGATEATETTANDTTGPEPGHHGDEDLSIDHDDDASHDDDCPHFHSAVVGEMRGGAPS